MFNEITVDRGLKSLYLKVLGLYSCVYTRNLDPILSGLVGDSDEDCRRCGGDGVVLNRVCKCVKVVQGITSRVAAADIHIYPFDLSSANVQCISVSVVLDRKSTEIRQYEAGLCTSWPAIEEHISNVLCYRTHI